MKVLGETVDPRIGREGLLPRLRPTPTHGVGTKRWPARMAGALLVTTGLGVLTTRGGGWQ